MKIPKIPFILLAFTCLVWALAPLAHAANPTATGHATKGVQLAQQGAFDQAVEEFTKAIQADPKDARFYRDRGGVYLTMKRFQDAVNDFTKAIELLPKRPHGLLVARRRTKRVVAARSCDGGLEQGTRAEAERSPNSGAARHGLLSAEKLSGGAR